ncbi:MAG TPA: RNA polymerase sigma factor [Gemmataceae bacterium]|nr:RNA polymerase sigma factor [Gemmataceae bacterium]
MANASLHPLLNYLRRVCVPFASVDEIDDGQLLHRFLSGHDESAFTLIVQRYGAMVWGLCVRRLGETPEAEDAFQATFLVLVRKAASLRTPQQLGPWLYGVAYRTALKLQARRAHKAAKERPLPEQTAEREPAESSWGELRPILDEEVNRLPEKYRQPVLLCYLQGMSSEEAARRLGCAKGTVFSRLSRARDLLRRRLVRRGVEVSAGALAAVLAENTFLRAAPPAVLSETTIRMSLLFATGTTSSAVSASLTALVEGVVRSMFLSKVKVAVIVLVTIGLLGSGAGFVAHRTAAGQPGDKPATTPDRPPSVAQKTKEKTKEKEKSRGDRPAPKPKMDEAGPDAKQDPATRLEIWRAQLTNPLNFEGIADPGITLQDALDKLGKQFHINFEINDKAFELDQVNHDVGATLIAGSKPIPPMRNTSLASVLRIILARVPAPSGAVYILRSDSVEITTTLALCQELNIARDVIVGRGPPEIPLVWDVFEETPISKALMRVTEQTPFTVIVDSSLKDRGKLNVTAQFNNVPVDTAVRLLANMADLSMVKLDNVFYLTTPEKAERLRVEHQRDTRGQPEK